MEVLLGPILYARTSTAERWRFALGILIKDPQHPSPPSVTLAVDPTTAQVDGPQLAADFTSEVGCAFWIWELDIPREDTARAAEYSLAGTNIKNTVLIPPRGAIPDIAFFSCNGVVNPRDYRRLEDPEEVWRRLRQDNPHLLVGGGDQIYADCLWENEDELVKYRKLSRANRITAAPSPEFRHKILRQYIDLYRERWSQEGEAGRTFARVPGIFTWDDHDIFDGWGSHDEREQAAPYFQQVFEAARRTFEAFQLGGRDVPNRVAETDRGHYLQELQVRGDGVVLNIVLLDLRSGRAQDTVLSEQQWEDFDAWLAAHREAKEEGVARHLLIVSSIPLVFMRFPALGDIIGFSLRDDLRDQWEHREHRGERARMVMTLLNHSAKADASISIISGDVHVGARARITSTDSRHRRPERTLAILEQITSSGIVFPPPSFLEFHAMRLIAKEGREDLAGNISTEIVPVWTDTYLPQRNFLKIGVDEEEHRLWFQWVTAERAIEPQVVIDP